jgi:hypothetical protein
MLDALDRYNRTWLLLKVLVAALQLLPGNWDQSRVYCMVKASPLELALDTLDTGMASAGCPAALRSVVWMASGLQAAFRTGLLGGARSGRPAQALDLCDETADGAGHEQPTGSLTHRFQPAGGSQQRRDGVEQSGAVQFSLLDGQRLAGVDEEPRVLALLVSGRACQGHQDCGERERHCLADGAGAGPAHEQRGGRHQIAEPAVQIIEEIVTPE